MQAPPLVLGLLVAQDRCWTVLSISASAQIVLAALILDLQANLCQTCLIGEYSYAGATICTACPSGRYADASGLSECIQVPGGRVHSR